MGLLALLDMIKDVSVGTRYFVYQAIVFLSTTRPMIARPLTYSLIARSNAGIASEKSILISYHSSTEIRTPQLRPMLTVRSAKDGRRVGLLLDGLLLTLAAFLDTSDVCIRY